MRKIISGFLLFFAVLLTIQLAGCNGDNGKTSTPSLSAITPASGVAGSSVTLTGSNFGATQGTSTVNFGATAATVTAWSATSITAKVPALAAGSVNVTVTVGGNASNSEPFTAIAVPVLTSLSPNSGAAGSSVTLTGSNFGATQGTSTVNFGTTTATVTAWSATSITATVPTLATGSVNVTVTVGGNASNSEPFTVVVAPILTSLSSTSGVAGSSVTLTGSNFGATQGTSTVNFGATTATVTAWSAASITVTVPEIAAGSVNITVTVGSYASNAVAYSVTASLGIFAITPNVGPAGSSVTLTGSNFGATQGSSTVNFGSTAATTTAWSDTSITATVPSLANGAVNVTVTVDGSTSNAVAFSVGITAGIPVSSLLMGINDWYDLPNAVWPVVQNSGVKMVRIGGGQQDSSPLACDTNQGDLIQQIQEIRSIGAEPIVQVSRLVDSGNLTSLAADAAAMVTCVNITNVNNGNLSKPVQYWSIGNEPDNSNSNTDDQIAAYAASYIKAIAPAMRDVDPSITILAPELSWYSDTKYKPLLGGSADITGTDSKGRYYIDVVTAHTYPNGPTAYTFAKVLNDELYGETDGLMKSLAADINTANTQNNRTGAHALTYGITEFNINYDNSTPNGATNLGVCGFLAGQYFASLYGSGMAQTTAAGQSAQFMLPWSINEGGGNCSEGDLGFLSGDPGNNPTPRSTYYHMQMLSQYLLSGTNPGYLSATSSQNTNGVLALATSSNSGQQLAVMILNEDQSNSHSISMSLDGSAVTGSGDAQIVISAGISQQYNDSIPSQTTYVLMFDAQGNLTKKVAYSLADLESNIPPQVQ